MAVLGAATRSGLDWQPWASFGRAVAARRGAAITERSGGPDGRPGRAQLSMHDRPASSVWLPLVLAWTDALHLPSLARLALRWGQR